MNVIIAYLETMFSAYPQTPRLLEAKAELQAMMEDAYTGFVSAGISENEAVGRVITDFGNLDELAPVLGITSEIAPAAPAIHSAGTNTAHSGQPMRQTTPVHPPVTIEDAKGFAQVHEATRFRLSIAVALFVLSPAALVTLPTFAETGVLALGANVAAAIGLFVLFVLVAAGILMLIGVSRDFGQYAAIREGRFTRNPVVTNWADTLAQQHDRRRINALQIAILLWVLSPAPLILGTLIVQGSTLQSLWSVIGVACVLVMVAVGLLVLLPTTWAKTVASTLDQTGGGTSTADDEHGIVGVIASIYWPLMVVIYLAWSFIGDAWDTSWIIWPIAGVLFGAIAAGSGAVEAYRKQRR